jgi:hypothetical protein
MFFFILRVERRFLNSGFRPGAFVRLAEFIGKIRLLGVNLPTSILTSAAFLKI